MLGTEVDMLFMPAHASISRIPYDGAGRVIDSLNERQHLSAQAPSPFEQAVGSKRGRLRLSIDRPY